MACALETIKTRSSIRAYKAEMLPDDVLNTLIEAGLQAPTAANRQEIQITVVKKDSPVLAELQKDFNADAPKTFYYDAPVVLFLSGPEDNPWAACDSGICVENISLAATAMGLGSLIIGCVRGVLTGEKKAYYNEKMGLKEGNVYQVAIALGYPDTTKEPHTYDFEKNVNFI